MVVWFGFYPSAARGPSPNQPPYIDTGKDPTVKMPSPSLLDPDQQPMGGLDD
jgi:hypothetical protein